MRILFDQGTPVPLRRLLAPRHEVSTAYEHRWSTLTNGTLLDAAEEAGFDLLVTTASASSSFSHPVGLGSNGS
jgi:hypothetical protein